MLRGIWVGLLASLGMLSFQGASASGQDAVLRVGVLDDALAQEIKRLVRAGVEVQVLQPGRDWLDMVEDDDSAYGSLNARAMQLRAAELFLYDARKERLSDRFWRERLMNQGVPVAAVEVTHRPIGEPERQQQRQRLREVLRGVRASSETLSLAQSIVPDDAH